MYDQHGRKRKVGNLYKSKKATPNFKKVAKKQFKRDEKTYPSAPVGEYTCLLYTSPSPRDKRQSRMPSSA